MAASKTQDSMKEKSEYLTVFGEFVGVPHDLVITPNKTLKVFAHDGGFCFKAKPGDRIALAPSGRYVKVKKA